MTNQGYNQESRVFDNRSSIGKFIFLGVTSMALCSFGPLSIFAPVPLILAFLLYGRLTTLLLGGICSGLLWFLSFKFQVPMLFTGAFLMALTYAILIAEVILRNVHPVRGMVLSGLLLLAVIGSGMFVYQQFAKTSIRTELSFLVNNTIEVFKAENKEALSSGGEEARVLQDLVKDPAKIVNEVMNSLPSILVIGTFIGLWVSFYMVLRNSLIWRYRVLYTYGLKDLMSFKTPDYFVWPLIGSLVLILGADYGLGAQAEVVGTNILYCLGIFYFFQGFGILVDFFKYLRVGGLMKSIFIALTLMFAWKVLAVVGIFDLWLDFRKFFEKKNQNEGDNI